MEDRFPGGLRQVVALNKCADPGNVVLSRSTFKIVNRDLEVALSE